MAREQGEMVIHGRMPLRLLKMLDGEVKRRGYGSRWQLMAEIIDRHFREIAEIRIGKTQIDPDVVEANR